MFSRFLLTLVPLCAIQAQTTSNPLSADVRQSYEAIKKNIMAAAEKVPEADYGFKPTPQIRSFGEVFGHVVSSQMHVCGAVAGNQGHASANATTKVEIVSALRDSFATCDKAFDSLTDSSATEMVTLPWGQKTKLGALAGIVNHDTEQYAIVGVYMRLKGLVPPSSERK